MNYNSRVTGKLKHALEKFIQSQGHIWKIHTDMKKGKQQNKFSSFKLFQTSLLYQTREFFNNSTLHGIRYIAESGRPFGERFMWFCFTGTGTVAALIIIVSLWEKFQTNPTITGLDTDFHNQQVIFPTINVCPTVPFNESRTWQIANTLGSYEEESAKQIDPFLKQLTYLSYDNIEEAYKSMRNFSTSDIKNFNKKSIKSIVSQVALFCNETFEVCKYKDEEISCCDNFQPIFTENGFCFSFNSRYKEKNNKEELNSNFHDLFETDKKWALYFQPKVQSQIYVHSHHENFGWDYRPQIIWDPGFTAELLISMKQTYTTEDARQLSIVQRKCIFPDEVKLDIYNDEYTFTSCMKECRIKKSMKFCKCVPPFYRLSNSQPYCRVDQFECLAKYAGNITDVRDCHFCELSCSNTVYDIEKLSKVINADGSTNTFIVIEYLTWPIIRYKREVLFGWVDLLVSFGGIAGLFLGFSLLSGVEIIYYFTMRAVCMLYQNRSELYEIEEKKQSRVQEKYNLSLKFKCNNSKVEDKFEGQTKIVKVSSNIDDVNLIPIKNVAELPKRMNRANWKLQAHKVRTMWHFAKKSLQMMLIQTQPVDSSMQILRLIRTTEPCKFVIKYVTP